VAVRFTRDGGGAGTFTLLDGDEEVGSAEIPRLVRIFGSMGLDLGRDGLSSVSAEYDGAFPFTGTLHEVRYQIADRAGQVDAAAETKAGFGTQ
jgi:hypothetical protein